MPALIVTKISVAESIFAKPPFTPMFNSGNGNVAATLSNYQSVVRDDLYLNSYWVSVRTAAIVTLICLILGYPTALFISQSGERAQRILVPTVALPFWVSSLIRAYAWISILHGGGPLTGLLRRAGLLGAHAEILGTAFSVHLGMIYSYLPFMILPLYAHLSRADNSLIEAAANLGAKPWTTFWRITVPISWPGIAAGSLLVFIPSIGEYVVPELLGGPGNIMISRVLWNEFFANRDWPMASAAAVLLLIAVVGPLMILRYAVSRLEAPK
jgi:putrescine transport system permease protein